LRRGSIQPSPGCTVSLPLPRRVIVYDRFGLHNNEVKPLLGLPGVDYYPFTRKLLLRMQLPTSAMQGSVYAHRLLLCLVPAVYQLTQPNKYNKEYAKSQVSMLSVPYSRRLLFGVWYGYRDSSTRPSTRWRSTGASPARR
jgi:hypothetical protein